jgi:hypothetical protein
MAQFGDGAEAVRIVAHVPGELGDIDIAHRVEVSGAACGPLLNPIDLAVAHEDPTVGRTGDPVRQPELARNWPGTGPDLARTVSGLALRAFQLTFSLGENICTRAWLVGVMVPR